MIRKAGNLFVTAYLLLIFFVYPFYMKQGYVDIGKAKYQFFIYSSLAAVGILAVIGGLLAVRDIRDRVRLHDPYPVDFSKMSVTDIFVLLYAALLMLSYSLSRYREEALWGTEGWYMGLVLKLTLCALYFFISRLWEGSFYIWRAAVIASGAVFILGILDRFSIYLIPLEIRQSAFISTLGNINWFCGYLSVLAPIGICLFLFREKGFWRWIWGVYAGIAFMAGFCQGGDSIFLIFGALFYLLLWIALKRAAWLTDYFLLVFIWGASAQAVRLLRLLIPDGYNYDTNNLCGYLTDSNITLVAAAAALGAYLLLRRRREFILGEGLQKRIHRIMAGALLAGIMLWLLLVGIHTAFGIPVLEGKSLFLFNEDWGNGRGAAFKSACRVFMEMSPLHKLTGAGPDCFAACAYAIPRVAGQLRDAFGSSRLTNAHNELLTSLVNEGIMGVCLLAGIFVPFFKKCIRQGEKNGIFYAIAVSIGCYFFHNMISFAQVLNFTFLFLILGMGEALGRGLDKP